ncbi:anaphase-promoting complex subunit cdc27 [Coemansia guatemalensis]|uniref:Anaphase-promoting complex subunit cdc27 n=1 Tax=Coemansia guatemalensis TaxID=2761395 RepID=A0A9W8HX14_9FUNG|nr:anaphase-promoting complex subunit cdc27 [Coemansia guatemalensis]
MIGRATDTVNRRRVARAAVPQTIKRSANSSDSNSNSNGNTNRNKSKVETSTAQTQLQTEEISRPQTEAERHSYERVIQRGLGLQQPHSVLFFAEAYHGWYHTTGANVAGEVLEQTIGHQTNGNSSSAAAADEVFDVRSVYWLALCYWHLGETSTAYAVLRPMSIEADYVIERSEGAVAGDLAAARSRRALACGLWLLAVACTRLEKWQEAEDHLVTLAPVVRVIQPPDEAGSTGADMRQLQQQRNEGSLYTVPTLADVSDLLGLVCVRTNRVAQSEAHSAEALRRNPLLWSACRRLGDLGGAQTLADTLVLEEKAVAVPRQQQDEPAALPQSKPTVQKLKAPVQQQQQQQEKPSSQQLKASTQSGRRMPTRLASKAPVGGEKRTRRGAAVQTPAASRSAAGRQASRSVQRDPAAERGLTAVQQLVAAAGSAWALAASHKADQALAAFARLPPAQQNAAWGLGLLGRTCFEAGRYAEAQQAFAAAAAAAGYRVRDMDAYSTLLWHMRDEQGLAQLATGLVAAGRTWSPEAWVAAANSFSLDGDHRAAQRSLARAVQLHRTAAPRDASGAATGLATAHALLGHESAALDEAARAQQAFRMALRIDARHYSAWYGLGLAYLRQGKPDLAEYHFSRAVALNAQNPLLLQSAGAVHELRGDYTRALHVYERVGGMLTAQRTHPAASLVAFKRARVLVVLERFGDAAAVLEPLLRRCPREFNVPFLLGQTYARLRRYREAAACLTRALDIAPEHAQSVREAFDALYQQSADEAAEDDVGADVANNTSPSSRYFESPSVRTGARHSGLSSDWRALGSADDRVDRALDVDL